MRTRSPIYYEFSGPINNIYASLVADLAISSQFGSVRLWRNRAEYEEAGFGVFGLALREIRRGCGHLDLYFDENTVKAQRELFVKYVDTHLREHGVTLIERLGLVCVCDEQLAEHWFGNALERGETEIRCPNCGRLYPVLGGQAGGEWPELDGQLHALKIEVARAKREAVVETKRAVERARESKF